MDDLLAARRFRDAGAEGWDVPLSVFAAALERSAAKAFAGRWAPRFTVPVAAGGTAVLKYRVRVTY